MNNKNAKVKTTWLTIPKRLFEEEKAEGKVVDEDIKIMTCADKYGNIRNAYQKKYEVPDILAAEDIGWNGKIVPSKGDEIVPSEDTPISDPHFKNSKTKEQRLIIYAALMTPPIDTATKEYLFKEDLGLKVGMSGKTFDTRWKNSGYIATSISTYTCPNGTTRQECIQLEKAIIRKGREDGYPNYVFKLNTMGKCTETFHFDAFHYLVKEFAILHTLSIEEIVEKYDTWSDLI